VLLDREVNESKSPPGDVESVSQPQASTWTLIVFICIGAFLRVYNFWLPPLWIDEYGTWWVAAGSSWTEAAERANRFQGQSPIYYLIVRLFIELLGDGPFSLRLPSVLFGIAALTVVYPLAMRIFQNSHVAISSVAVFAVSERITWYSQIARPYSLALFLSLLSFWFFLGVLQTERKTCKVGYILSTALIVYAHYLFGFVIIIQLAYLLWVSGWRQVLSKSWVLSFSLIAFFVLPITEQFIDLIARRHTLNWMSDLHLSLFVSLAIDFLYGSFSLLTLVPTVLVAILLGFKWEEQYKPETRAKLRLPVMWLTIPFLTFIVLPKLFGIRLFAPRYLLFAYPAVFFLMAWFMSNLRVTDGKKWIPLGLFLTLTLTFTSVPAAREGGTFSYWDAHGWDKAANVLAASYLKDDVIALRTGFVEADLMAANNDRRDMVSYLNWPIVAHLDKQRQYKIVILPYRLNETTQTYLNTLREQVSKHPRVWIVGEEKSVNLFRNTLTSKSGYQIAHQSAHGKVGLILLEKRVDRR